MKNIHTFIVHFWLKKKSIRKNGTIPIYLRIRLDGNSADISTKVTVMEEHWCSKAERVNPKAKDAKYINNALDDISSDIKNTYRELTQEERFLSAQTFKLRYFGKDKPIRTLGALIEYHRTIEIPKLKIGTAKNYRATEKYLKSFVSFKYKTSDIPLNQIDYAFVLSFENYLRTCKPLMKSHPLRNNGVIKHLQRFKKMTTIAHKLACIKQDFFAFLKQNSHLMIGNI